MMMMKLLMGRRTAVWEFSDALVKKINRKITDILLPYKL